MINAPCVFGYLRLNTTYPWVVEHVSSSGPTKCPPWLMSCVKQILDTTIPAPSKSPVQFEISPNASLHNTNLLIEMNYSIERLINSFPLSELGCGSEFRSASILRLQLQHRKNWDRMESFLTTGFSASFRPIDDVQRQTDNEKELTKGNHKSSTKHLNVLRNKIKKRSNADVNFPLTLK